MDATAYDFLIGAADAKPPAAILSAVAARKLGYRIPKGWPGLVILTLQADGTYKVSKQI